MLKRIELYILITISLFFSSLAEAGVINVAPTDTRKENPYTINLEESIKIALEKNPSLRIAEQEILAARAKVKEVQTGFFPQLKFGATYTRLGEVPAIEIPSGIFGPLPSFIEIGKEDIYNYGISLEEPLYLGGSLKASFKGAKNNLQRLKSAYETKKEELVFKVKDAYFGILKAEKFKEVSEQGVKQLEAHLKVVKDRYKVGLVPRNDVLFSEVKLANAEENLIRSGNAFLLAREAFKNILGLNLETEIEIIEVESPEPTSSIYEDAGFPSLKECITEALKNRPEIGEIQANLAWGENIIQRAKSGWKPRIMLLGSYGWEKGSTSYPEDFEESWTAVLSLSISLWDWGRAKEQVHQAEAGLKKIKEVEILLKNGIILEVKRAYLSLEEAEKRIEVTQKIISQAEENFRIVQERYREGRTTNSEVLDAQTLLSEARTRYFQSFYDYSLARAKLKRATGMKTTDAER